MHMDVMAPSHERDMAPSHERDKAHSHEREVQETFSGVSRNIDLLLKYSLSRKLWMLFEPMKWKVSCRVNPTG